MPTFDLQKEEKKVRFILDKKSLPKITATVGFNLDVSGSIEGLFNNGTVQAITQRIMPVALNFDDNGELDTWIFSDGSRIAKIANATAQNLNGYIAKQVLKNREVESVLWHSTDYCPVMTANMEEYGFIQETGGGFFKAKSRTFVKDSKSGAPAIIYHVTDGENNRPDRRPVHDLLMQAQNAQSNIYFMFVGIGSRGDFGFLEEVADKYGNTGFLKIKDIESAVDDDSIYEQLLGDELIGWLRNK